MNALTSGATLPLTRWGDSSVPRKQVLHDGNGDRATSTNSA